MKRYMNAMEPFEDQRGRLPAQERHGPGWDPGRPKPAAEGPRQEIRRHGFLSVSVAGGKGGVGKTNLVTNLAVVMASMGRRVLLLDGDLGLANVDLLLGLVPSHNLYDVVTGQKRLDEIVLTGPGGIRIIPASSGVEEMASLDDYRREVLVRGLEDLARGRDVLLIDTGSGIHRQNLRLAQMADEILVLTTPEPTAFSDAYATIKLLAMRRLARPPRLVVNMARSEREALRVAERVARVAQQFLGFEPELFGVIPRDEAVPRAVKAQQPFAEAFPESAATAGVRNLAQRLLLPSETPEHRVQPTRSDEHMSEAA